MKGWDLICWANLARAHHSSTVSRIITLALSGKPTGPLGELMPVFTCFAYKRENEVSFFFSYAPSRGQMGKSGSSAI